MPLSPPLCLPFSTLTTNSSVSANRWNVTITIPNPQGTQGGSVYYDGNNIAVNQWIANGNNGYAWVIVSIVTKSGNSVTCVVEDYLDWNLYQDPSGDGPAPFNGIGGFVFELNNGLPMLTEVVVFPNVTWTDSLVGRFVSQTTGGGGSGASGPTGPTGPTGAAGPTGPTTAIIFDGGNASTSFVLGPVFDCGTSL
jgi:hypothetical protein